MGAGRRSRLTAWVLGNEAFGVESLEFNRVHSFQVYGFVFFKRAGVQSSRALGAKRFWSSARVSVIALTPASTHPNHEAATENLSVLPVEIPQLLNHADWCRSVLAKILHGSDAVNLPRLAQVPPTFWNAHNLVLSLTNL